MDYKTRTATDALTDRDLKRIEENILHIREESTLPLVLEARSDYPSHVAGRMFYHSGDKKVYTSTGTAWV